jgi:hypothetical protein
LLRVAVHIQNCLAPPLVSARCSQSGQRHSRLVPLLLCLRRGIVKLLDDVARLLVAPEAVEETFRDTDRVTRNVPSFCRLSLSVVEPGVMLLQFLASQ